MIFKITARLFFDNGQVKKVDWLENNLIKKTVINGVDAEVTLNVEEATHEFRKLFLKYTKTGDVLTVPNIQGEISVIPFSKLYYATVAVTEYAEVSDTEPPSPPEKPEKLEPRVVSER